MDLLISCEDAKRLILEV